VNELLDFLSFRTLVSQQVLIVFYYLGAVGMPLAAWVSARYLLGRFELARDAYDTGKQLLSAALPRRHRPLMLVLFLIAFLFLELLWRMLFEYLIAFMQMRDALVG
jgi:hypothetical protein